MLPSAADVARGTNGTLRANYNGEPIQLSNPTIDQFFNTSAFSVPAPGQFGNAASEPDHRPGSRLLNAQFSRDVRMGSNRTVTLQLNATNLLNMVNYASVDSVGELADLRPDPVGAADAVDAVQYAVQVLTMAASMFRCRRFANQTLDAPSPVRPVVALDGTVLTVVGATDGPLAPQVAADPVRRRPPAGRRSRRPGVPLGA